MSFPASVRRLCLLAAVLMICGCGALRRPDPTVELLEAELRWLEDNLYHLDDQLDRCCEQLESARRNNSILRLELAEARSVTTDPSTSKSRKKTDDLEEGFDQPTDEELYEFEGPIIITGDADTELDQPDDDANSGSADADDPAAGDIRLEGVPDPAALPAPQDEPDDPASDPFQSDEANGNSDRVSRVVLNRRLTGGYNFDRKAGHEGVMVVIEPQNTFAQYLPVPGEVTVEVRDPQKPGLRGRVGKWKFDSVESAALLKETAMGRGIHLQLPWPGAPPQNEQLLLSVSYETPDGRILRQQKKFRIHPTESGLASKADEAERPAWSPDRPIRTASSLGK